MSFQNSQKPLHTLLILRLSSVESSCSRFQTIPVSSRMDVTTIPIGESEDRCLDREGVTKHFDRVEFKSRSPRA